MKTQLKSKSQFAVCINNAEYPASLELHRIYRIIPDKEAAADGDLRIIDESGEDYLYPASFFLTLEIPRATAQALHKSLGGSLKKAA